MILRVHDDYSHQNYRRQGNQEHAGGQRLSNVRSFEEQALALGLEDREGRHRCVFANRLEEVLRLVL